ncbi:MAG: hypothetical protein PHD86_09130 [Kiritimatiellae bacterium]|nr:hypothetical protein [Kiritimatiellia bacterium]
MVNRSFQISAGLLLTVILGLSLAWFLQGRDERQILRRQKELVELLSKTAPEKELAALTRARQISVLFTDPVSTGMEPYLTGSHSRQDMAGLAYHLRSMVEELSIEIADHKLEIKPNGDSAVLAAVARAKARSGGEWMSDLREVEMRWSKTDDGWLVNAVTFTSAIKRPEGL